MAITSEKNRTTKSRELSDHVVQTTKAEVDGNVMDVTQGEVHSDVRFEDDLNEGKPVIIRSFDFKANPEAFAVRTPSGQELFNAHIKQIEVHLWKDGLQVMPDVKPQLKLAKNRSGYRIVVGAEQAKGHILSETPQSLMDLTK
jgi:hypothetical protein